MNLPIEFIEKMNKLLKDDAKNFFEALEKPPIKGITVNFNKINKNDFLKLCDFNLSPVESISNGYYVDNFKFSKNILNHLGIIYSQEPSAMYPVELLDISANEFVLDICASPGGKSIQILEKLNNTGLLVSNEIVFNRAKILYENLNRMGFENYAITCNSPEDFEKCNIQFDKILVDAPCGGEGMIRKQNFDINVYNPNSIETNAKRQLKILESIKDLLKPGGRLVYSTCTYDILENENVIKNFIQNNPEFKIIEINKFKNIMQSGIKLDNTNTDYGYRRYPHIHKGEGQFMIALEKKGTSTNLNPQKFKANNYTKPNTKELNIINELITKTTTLKNYQIIKRNESFYMLPNSNINFNNLNLLHIGCLIGTIQKNIFKYSYNFYHTFGKYFKKKIDLSKSDLEKYLHGEEIDTDKENGIYAITYQGIYLSGGKITNQKLKNIYPKELRI